jgi:hypothetical protein
MTTKLTLSIDDRVINSAKRYAQGEGKSLSGLVENYLKSITTVQKETETMPPQVKKLRGSLKLPKDFDYKTELGIAIGKKYFK